MATPPNLVQFAFAAGIDQSQQAELLDPLTGFTYLQNVRQVRRGGVEKRLGFLARSRTRLDATTRTAGNRLLCHEQVMCTIDGTHLDAFSETLAASATSSRVPDASVTTRTLSTATSSLYDTAHVGGYIATLTARANASSTDLLLSVETVNGVVLRSPEVVVTSSATPFGVLATYSTYIIFITGTSTGGNLAAYYLNTASAAAISTGWVSIGNVATDKTTSGTVPRLQLHSQSLTNRVAFAYVNNSGGASQLTVKTMTISGVVETATVNTSSVTPDCINIEGSIADTLWVAWNESTAIKVCGLDADSLGTTLATTATIITALTAPSAGLYVISSATAGRGRLLVHDGNSLYTQLRNFQTTAGAAATDGAQVTVFDVRIDARPIQVGGRYYGLFRSANDNTTVLCDWTDATTSTTAWMRPVACAFPGLTRSSAGHPIVFSATSFGYATPVRRSSVGDSVELITYDLADRARWRSASHNGSLYLSGGVLSYYDGRRVAEASFLFAPRAPVAADSGSGSGPTGTYRYVTTFEEMDDDGNWCLSAVSLPSDVLSITNNIATVTVYPLVITNRLTPSTATVDKRVRRAVYRTLTGGEPPYYFVGSVENNTAAASTLSDSTTDANLTSNRLLYGTGNLPGTNGSAQDRRAPPYCQDVASYNGMLVVASGSELWWSGQTVVGEGVWFNPLFSVPVEGDGKIVALAVQDGTLYAFKRQSIHVVAGEAPSDNGASGGLGTPRRLAVDVGCIDANSVVVTSAGIFFQSDRGIELLTRSQTVEPIGEAVQETLADFPVVSSAVLDTRHGVVRISLAQSESGGRVSGTGATLVYDLTTRVWQSVDVYFDDLAATSAAVVYLDGAWRYAWLDTDGYVYTERDADDASAHLDDSEWITMIAETSWVKTGGLQGKQHVNCAMLLARTHTDHGLSISLAYNYSDTFESATAWPFDTINDLLTAGWPITQLKHLPHDEAECQSVRIRVRDSEPSSGEEGPSPTLGSQRGSTWLGLTLDITPKPGVFDVPEEAA